MRQSLQILLQTIFLLVFILLYTIGKVQIWMVLFLVGIIVSIFLGRIYCGWVCPINSVMCFLSWLREKLKLKPFKIPECFKYSWVRYAALGLFLAVLMYTLVSGNKIPVLPALFLAGIVLTTFFPEELWHCYLCPYGTILRFSAAKTGYSFRIDKQLCNNCGLCIRTCPVNAIEKKDHNPVIINPNCLVCTKCSNNCKQKAISYSTKN